MDRHARRAPRAAAIAAVIAGLAAGSYGVANAASGSGSAQSSGSTPTDPANPPTAQNPWGGQRGDETLLSGDVASKVTAAAQAKVSGGTIVRVETDADGHAAYEAHMVDASGSPVTVYVDEQFDVVGVESR